MATNDDYSANRFQKVTPDMPVRDCEAALRYYVDVLGFSKDFDDTMLRHDRIMFAGVSRGACSLTLDQHGIQNRSPVIINCDIDDVDLLYEEYASRGVKVTAAPEDKPWGKRAMSIEDPDGNNLNFSGPMRK